jgi:hypothetical protein
MSTLPRFAGGTVTMLVTRRDENTYLEAAVPGQPARLGVDPRGCASNLKVIS